MLADCCQRQRQVEHDSDLLAVCVCVCLEQTFALVAGRALSNFYSASLPLSPPLSPFLSLPATTVEALLLIARSSRTTYLFSLAFILFFYLSLLLYFPSFPAALA